jgi:DNA-binding transcriptional LysR family regulator
MELRHLRYFQAVAEFGSVTAAARRLHVSQSSISEQIGDLEQELGCPLLDRSRRQIRLTAQGQVFLAETRRTLEAAQRAVDVTRRSMRGEVGALAIGFFLWGAGGFFPRIIREYRRLRPGIRLSLMEMHAAEQIAALEEGRIDVGLTRPLQPPHDRVLRSELLYRDPVVVAMRPDHPLARRTVKVGALAGERLVSAERRSNPTLFDSIVSLCAAEGFSPQIANTSGTWSGVLTLVEAGEGIALVPSGVKNLRIRGLVFRPLGPAALSLGLAAVWNPRNEGPALMEFLRLLREHRDRLGGEGEPIPQSAKEKRHSGGQSVPLARQV